MKSSGQPKLRGASDPILRGQESRKEAIIVSELAREMRFFGYRERRPAPFAITNPPAPPPSDRQAAGKTSVYQPFQGYGAIWEQREQPCFTMEGLIAKGERADPPALEFYVGTVKSQISETN
jgi:hypothetical protein